MDVSLAQAANAYSSVQSMQGGDEDASSDDAAATGVASFNDVLKQALDSVASTENRAEAMAMQTATGVKTDLTDMVTAVANAQLTLSTVVAIRDRVIAAYQSIIGMSI